MSALLAAFATVAALLAPGIAAAKTRADEITFEAANPSLKRVKVRFADGRPQELLVFGPATLSPPLIAAIKSQRNGALCGYLDGLDLRSREGTSASLYVLPMGAADERKFARDFHDYFVGSIAGFREPAPSPRWTSDCVNNVSDARGVPVSRALARLGKHVARMEKLGRAPGFQLGVLVNRGSVRWQRFVLSTLPLDDDSPDRPLTEKLLSAQPGAPAPVDADEIRFEGGVAAVKRLKVQRRDGAPATMFVHGPASLSAETLAAIRSQQNNRVFGYLGGLDLASLQDDGFAIYVMPAGAADDPKFHDHYQRYLVQGLSRFAWAAAAPPWLLAPINNVGGGKGVLAAQALAMLGAHVERLSKGGGTPSFQVGFLLDRQESPLRWQRFVLTTRRSGEVEAGRAPEPVRPPTAGPLRRP